MNLFFLCALIFSWSAEKIEVSRAELAFAYLRLEQALRKSELSEQQIAQLNQQFDASLPLFFQKKYAEALQVLHELTWQIGQAHLPKNYLLFTSCLGRVEKQVQIKKEAKLLQLKLQCTQKIANDNFSLRVKTQAENKIVWEQPLPLTTDNEILPKVWDYSLNTREWKRGTYLIEIADKLDALQLGYFFVVEESFLQDRENNQRRLTALEPATAEIQRAVFSCQARNALLKEDPSLEKSAEFIVDPNQLLQEIKQEILALEAGQNPYHARAGIYWSAVESVNQEVPLNIYCPVGLAEKEKLPVVFALHGAGLDENMFLYAFGAGILRELAERYGFLVVTPRAGMLLGHAEVFDEILSMLGDNYSIDKQHVYVIGHSLGAMAAADLAQVRSAQITAACCLAGGSFRNQKTSPTLLMAAEFDGLFSPESLRTLVENAQAQDLPVEFQLVKNYGHVLMVGAVLPQVIEWFMQHK